MKNTKDYGETATVAELIAALQTLPPDAPVLAEGCDCIGPVGGISKESGAPGEGDVYVLGRPDSHYVLNRPYNVVNFSPVGS